MEESTLGVLFAILASAFFGVSAVLARPAVMKYGGYTGAWLSVVASLVVVAAGTFLFDWQGLMSLSVGPILLFVAVGLFNFVIGRSTYYASISRIGASRATALSNITPMFSMLLAVLFLGESINLMIFLGGLAIVAGGLVRFVSRPLNLVNVLPRTVSSVAKTVQRVRTGETMAAPA